MTPYDIVKLARDSKRPTGLDYVKNVFNDFIELHGDRLYMDDSAIVAGIARLNGKPVTVIAIEKGHTALERAHRNFGAPNPEGYRKALRLMKQAEKFNRPIVCLIDTSGAYCGIGAEERGQGQAIAENLLEMSTINTPIISILIGEGGSGGALALAVADRVWSLENAVYSVISPEGCASILWKDAGKAEQAAESLKLTAQDAKALGVIEEIISEDNIGTEEFYFRVRDRLAEELELLKKDTNLLENRYNRFRKIGSVKKEGQAKNKEEDKNMSIYKKYCKETLDEKGNVINLELDYPENFNFGYDVVDEMAKTCPDKRALVWCNTEKEEHIFTFADIKNYSNKMANVLKNAGIKRGDNVFLVLKRHYEYWFAAIALNKLGAVMIPATHMLTIPDIVYRLKSANVKAVICTNQDEVPEKIKQAADEVDKKIKLWCVQGNVKGFKNITAQMENESADFERMPTLATDPMLVYFTSGTTGNPKGVIHDFAYPLAHIVTAKYWLKNNEHSLHFTVAETGWAKASWGKIYGQWLSGSAVMVYDFDNFEPKNLTTIINEYGVTSFCAPPTVYRYLVRKGITSMPSLKHASTAGEMLAPEVSKLFTEQTGITLCEGYGQSETTLLLGNFECKRGMEGSMGTPSPLYKIELRDKNGNPVEKGEIGEVCIVPKNGKKPEGIFCGYIGNKEQYDYVWRYGVYHTGDIAYQDENGVFWFHGRFDDIIKTGGYRVGPYEVENVLMEHPAVMECSVVGVPDTLRGQAIKAFILLSNKYEPSKALEKEIKEYCNTKLAEYKWIRFIEFVEELPKTFSGKIKKVDLRKKEQEKFNSTNTN